MNKKSLAVVILLSLTCFGSVIAFNEYKQSMIENALKNRPEQSSPVVSEILKYQDYTPFIETIGFVKPEKGVDVNNESAGVVTKILFNSGDIVKKGQILIELDNSVETAKLESLQAKLPAAKSQYEGDLKLYKNKTIAKRALDKSEADYQSLIAEIASLNATIDKKIITAPFDGMTGLIRVQLGEFLNVGSNITRLENMNQMKMNFSVSQKYFNQINLKQKVFVTVEANKDAVYTGEISAIEPTINPNTGLFEIEVLIPNKDHSLRTGMYATVRIKEDTLKEQLIIPQTAIQYALYGESVFVVYKDKEGKERVKQQFVKTGKRINNDVIITEGLNAGDQVVTNGQVRLNNNSLVHESNDKTLSVIPEMKKL